MPLNQSAPDSCDQSLYIEIRRAALSYLARRDYFYQELVQKLHLKGFHLIPINIVLNSFIEQGYLDDCKTAEIFLHYRRKRGFGPLHVTESLKNKGVSAAIIAEVVKITDNAWLSVALTIWQKHFKRQKPKTAKERAKHSRFLMSRGFTYEQINQVLAADDMSDLYL